MAFTPPSYDELWINSRKIEWEYSSLMGRYKVKETNDKKNDLELLIARTNESVINCTTKRESQREVFILLVNELRKLNPDDEGYEQKAKQGALFLLGALLHRYFRIIKEYNNSLTFFTTALQCDLMNAIRQTLRLSSRDPKTFCEDDLKQLDIQTVVDALRTFQENMLLKDEKHMPRFMNYPHFKKDVHFEAYLQDIINEQIANDRAQSAIKKFSVLKQFDAIRYLETLAQHIKTEHMIVLKGLDDWCATLKKDQPEFKTIDNKVFAASINKLILPPQRKEQIIDFSMGPHVQEQIEQGDHESLLQAIKECILFVDSSVLCGAYALLMETPGIDPCLIQCLCRFLGESKDNLFTERDRFLNIEFLKSYLDKNKENPGLTVNTQFFGGLDAMIGAVNNLYYKLRPKFVKEEEKPTEHAAAHI